MRLPLFVCVFVCFAVVTIPLFAQTPNGNVNGLVSDPTSAAVADAEIIAVNDVTGIQYATKTNREGIYVLPNLPPGPYRVQVSKVGFKTLIKPDIVLNVQDSLSINFTLLIGAFHEIVTVQGGAPLVNTENASVSTVVDRQFAENLPMNGRSFQTLIDLTPGVVLTASNPNDSGQFSFNGQRASSNYWMVDGVSANIGISASANLGNGFTGSLGSFSVQGGTNSLVSVDAMQEFRIQTSTYAPEFGRTPGGQISIVTRSGTNQFHGTVFDYLRNDLFDASDWFNGFTNNPPLPKAKERQNDFGGTFNGPIIKSRTFFFFSYEGLRLRLPQTALTSVPDVAARNNAAPALQPYLHAFPMPNGADDAANGIAQFNASYSNPASLDAYSLRIDHKAKENVSLFARYNYSPSSILQRGNGDTLSTVSPSHIKTETATGGIAWNLSAQITNDLHVNYSRTSASTLSQIDNFGGAVPPPALPFPSPFTSANASFEFGVFSLQDGFLSEGRLAHNVQRQFNLVENLSLQTGKHSLKFGADFRRLSPSYDPQLYLQADFFSDVPSAMTGALHTAFLLSSRNVTALLRNLGVFAQDTWQINSRLNAMFGLRWDVDFAPSSNPAFVAVTGYNLRDLSNLALASPGTPPFKTPYANIAPRVGVAYQIRQSNNWQTVFRGGFGVFFDLATQELGNNISSSSYPFGASNLVRGASFPLDPSTAAPPPISVASLATHSFSAFNPNLKLPYTLEWNVALEQALGNQQSVSASYVGSGGRRLLQSAFISSPTPNFAGVQLVTNTATSSYNALQLQFHRRLTAGLQALASYTWSHSIDDASAGSSWNASNLLVPAGSPRANRGPSDFDVRDTFTVGATYELPSPRGKAFAVALLRGWSLQSIVQVRSAPPVDVTDSNFQEFNGGIVADVRPDLVPEQALYLFGLQYPGGRAFNPFAFMNPPVDPNTGNPVRQGDVGRNALRGFGAAQWDFAVHRDIPIHESIKLQFRAELFNALNHPNFGQPIGDINNPQFGQSTSMLGQYLSGGSVGSGALSPLYQIGGPRSVQLALKLMF